MRKAMRDILAMRLQRFGKHKDIGIQRFVYTYGRGPLAIKRLIDMSTNRQTIISTISTYQVHYMYHRYKGLSSPLKTRGDKRIPKPLLVYTWHMGIYGLKV